MDLNPRRSITGKRRRIHDAAPKYGNSIGPNHATLGKPSVRLIKRPKTGTRIKIASLCAGLAFSAVSGPAFAGDVSNPLPITVFHRASGTITVGGTAQNIAFTQNGSLVRCVQNPSNQTEDLYLDMSGPASSTPGMSFDLPPGNSPFCMGGSGVFLGNWSVVAVTTGHPYIAFEGQ